MAKYRVEMRCVVTKEVTLEGCTYEEALTEPWKHAVDEYEVSQEEWEILNVIRDD